MQLRISCSPNFSGKTLFQFKERAFDYVVGGARGANDEHDRRRKLNCNRICCQDFFDWPDYDLLVQVDRV